MRRIISTLLFLYTAAAVYPQSLITRSFHDIPLSKALVEIDQSTDEQHIVFVYDELEDFIVEGTFKDAPITQVIKTLIGYYPIHIETEGDKIFVECTQKEPYHLRGRIVSENGSPLTNVNIAIIEHDSIIGGGRSNAGGQFVIPHTTPQATARISHVGYQTQRVTLSTAAESTIRLREEIRPLGDVTVEEDTMVAAPSQLSILTEAGQKAIVSEDSLEASLQVLVARERQLRHSHRVEAAVLEAFLALVLPDSAQYRRLALSDLDALAAARVKDYPDATQPLPTGKYFNDDMLSVVGYDLKAWREMHDYYECHGNRAATMLTALEMVREEGGDIHHLDSLMHLYGDLDVSVEIAIEKCQRAIHSDLLSQREKIDELSGYIKRYKHFDRVNILRNLFNEYTRPTYQATFFQQELTTADSVRIRVHQRNTLGMTLRISGTDYKIQKTFDEYSSTTDTLTLPPLATGFYSVSISFKSKPRFKRSDQIRTYLNVSDVRPVLMPIPDEGTLLTAVDAISGEPLPQATVQYDDETHPVNAHGETTIPELDEIDEFTLRTTGKGFYNVNTRFGKWVNYSADANDDLIELAELMTDRSIYRPGQAVHIAVVAYANQKSTCTSLEGRDLDITVKNPQSQVIDTLHVKTDRFGSAHCIYHIPMHTPLGRFTFDVDGDIFGRTSIRVDEYKRPTFEMTIDESEDVVRIGDTLHLKGHANMLTGEPVRHAAAVVHSRMTTGVYSRGKTVAERCDTVQTDSEGRFDVSIPVKSALATDQEATEMAMHITASVTDEAGETHDTYRYYRFDQKGMTIKSDIGGQLIEQGSAAGKPVTVGITNFANKRVKTPIDCCISRCPRDGQHHKATEVLRLTTDSVFALPADLQPGRYVLTATCRGETRHDEFIIFDRKATRPCIDTDDWYDPDAEAFDFRSGEPLRIRIGSSEEDVHIYYAVYGVDTLLAHGRLDLSNAIVCQEFPYQEAFGDGITVYHAWYKNGRYHHHEKFFYQPQPEKELKAEWTSLRDRLTPGQHEEWQLRLTHPDGTPADAQMMVSLYDRSLDQFAPHKWTFRPQMQHSFVGIFDEMEEDSRYHHGSQGLLARLPEPTFGTPQLTAGWPGVSTVFHGQVRDENEEPVIGATVMIDGRQGGTITDIDGRFSLLANFGAKITVSYIGYEQQTVRLVNRLTAIRLFPSEAALDEVVVVGYGTAPKRNTRTTNGKTAVDTSPKRSAITAFNQEDTGALSDEYSKYVVFNTNVATADKFGLSGLPVRENLQETAFFYPALRTDADGRVSIAFTLPESLTSWQLLGEAHTRDLDYAVVSATATAHKDLMVQPNMPRFVRMGDKATITASITNTSERPLTGKATMVLTDPETERVVYTQTQPFTVAADNSTTATFAYHPAAGTPTLLTCKIMASADGMSDGEQHYLPVLSDREQVMRTRSFTLHDGRDLTLSVDDLFPKESSDRRLTLEYTNNPSWLILQALHRYVHPTDECAVCQAVAYLSQTAAAKWAAQPRIAEAVRRWQTENDSTTLLSPLSRNDDLKNILVEESPMTLDAATETDQKQQLAELLDVPTLTDLQNRTINALRSLQNNDGSWSWWKGMSGSYYITRLVTELLVRTNVLCGQQKKTKPMLDEAFRYLARFGADPHYLYLCRKDGRQPSDSLHREVKKETRALAKQGNDITNIYHAAMRAIILQKDKPRQAAALLDTIMALTVCDKEKGRYFDSFLTPYSWLDYKIPTHVMVMEALQAIRPDDTRTMDEMRQWLLQEKRTQYWVTTVNSANAIFAFLNGNMTALEETPMPTIRFGGQPIDTSSATAAFGYLKASPPTPLQGERGVDSPLLLEMSTHGSDGTPLTLEGGRGRHTSWGALYAQYTQPMAEVGASGNDLTVKREIIAPHKGALRVGDKVRVRITLKAGRDLDFVQINDKRAACMEPVDPLSGYKRGYYVNNRDCSTQYFIGMLPKGTHVIETEYYIDRPGTYESGTCTAQCAYAPEYSATAPAVMLTVGPHQR